MPKQKNNFLFNLFSLLSILYSTFFSLFSETCLCLLTHVLSLPLSSLDQIPSPSLTLNLNHLSLFLHLKSNPNKLLSSLFIEQQDYGSVSTDFGSWVSWLQWHWGFWSGGWLSLLVDGLVGLVGLGF